jgi:transposase
VVCPTPAQHIVFQEYVRAVNEHTERLQRLAPELQAQVKTWRLSPVVEALQARRGVQFTVAVTTVAELGDLPRFQNPRERMKFLGLIPSEYATGERRRQGAITKAGNSHARRALVEGAWAYRYPATVSRHLQLRLAQQPKVIPDSSWKAQVRRCKRYRTLIARGKHANQVVVALARALMGCMGASAKEIPVTPSDQTTAHDQPATQKVACVHRQRRSPGVV